MKFYSPGELAMLLKIEEGLILNWLDCGELIGFKVGDVWRIEESHFEDFLRQRCNNKDVFLKKSDRKSKYAALTEYLNSCGEVTTLSFEEIENILGVSLPKSARTYRAWWSNDGETHVQALGWLNAQKKVLKIDLKKHSVVFSAIK